MSVRGFALAVVVAGTVALVTHQPPTQLPIATGAVVPVTVVDWLFTRATGTRMPLWNVTPEVAKHG